MEVGEGREVLELRDILELSDSDCEGAVEIGDCDEEEVGDCSQDSRSVLAWPEMGLFGETQCRKIVRAGGE